MLGFLLQLKDIFNEATVFHWLGRRNQCWLESFRWISYILDPCPVEWGCENQTAAATDSKGNRKYLNSVNNVYSKDQSNISWGERWGIQRATAAGRPEQTLDAPHRLPQGNPTKRKKHGSSCSYLYLTIMSLSESLPVNAVHFILWIVLYKTKE